MVLPFAAKEIIEYFNRILKEFSFFNNELKLVKFNTHFKAQIIRVPIVRPPDF